MTSMRKKIATYFGLSALVAVTAWDASLLFRILMV